MKLVDYKNKYLDYFHDNLPSKVAEIAGKKISHKEKAKEINKIISEHRNILVSEIDLNAEPSFRQEQLIIIQYAVSVASLEYRHAVWPYEYMALSRRVGELWESFCSAAWDASSRDEVSRIDPPKFHKVLLGIEKSLLSFSKDEEKDKMSEIVNSLKDLIGEINMIEDEVFTIGENPHVIDFKSGFGSNEKGNMLRLRAVGKAYKIWNANTELLLLVRQNKNNNYLNIIKKDGLWSVHCGDAAYVKIEEITGARMNKIRKEVVCFEDDLSPKFWKDLREHLSDLSGYLKW